MLIRYNTQHYGMLPLPTGIITMNRKSLWVAQSVALQCLSNKWLLRYFQLCSSSNFFWRLAMMAATSPPSNTTASLASCHALVMMLPICWGSRVSENWLARTLNICFWLNFHLKLNDSQTVTGIWWQSLLQAELTKWFGDILVNDNTYNWNNSGYPLNIGVVIDNTGTSCNAWYALHATEDLAHHNWVLQCHLDSTGGIHPEVFASDWSQTLISSIEATLPLTNHIYCLHHLDGNVTTNLQGSLGTEWSNFQHDFWVAYHAVLPEEFDCLWKHLVTRYHSTQAYLNAELFPSHEWWAWAWVSFKFTAGVQTNGWVEAENSE